MIAVSPKLGVSTMEELIEKKPKMNVSIAVNDCVDFAIKTLLKAHGISQSDFIKWGGTVDEVVRPSNPHRRDGIVSGDVHMVIDEGMDSWGDVAVANNMIFLSYSEEVLKKLEAYGFQRARLDHGRIAGIDEPTTVVDFSGWPIVVHEKFPDELAYHIAGVLDKIREEIPYDAAETPSMASLCTNTEAGPLDFRLSGRGAVLQRKRVYVEKERVFVIVERVRGRGEDRGRAWAVVGGSGPRFFDDDIVLFLAMLRGRA